VGIGDHQLHPGQAAGFQRLQTRRPKRAVLGLADLKSQYLAAPVGHPVRSGSGPREALMGASGNDMSSLQPNSGGDEDGDTRPSKSYHHAEPTAPLHELLLVEGLRGSDRGCTSGRCRFACGSAVLGADVGGSTPIERNICSR
jgi:hypothetical protein